MSENLRQRLLNHRSKAEDLSPTNWVFPNESKSNHLSLNNSRTRVVAKTVRELKLPKMGWHTFRHIFATRGAEAGVPLRVMQELLGHSSPVVTAKYYQHIGDQSLRDAIEKVAAA